ncbi:MAG: LytR C-terminal domain-containing protein [Cumulibacter sp.]
MSESKAPRRPGGRRPIPPLIFLIVLAVLAVGVWWQVIRKNDEQVAKQSAPCTMTASEEELAELKDLGKIQVVVLNGTDQTGLAASIESELTGRGFTVTEVGNADDGTYSTAGTIRYGTGSKFQADLVAANFPDFDVDRSNHITDGTIHVIAGTAYNGIADANQSTQTIDKLVAAEGKVQAGCPASDGAEADTAEEGADGSGESSQASDGTQPADDGS